MGTSRGMKDGKYDSALFKKGARANWDFKYREKAL